MIYKLFALFMIFTMSLFGEVIVKANRTTVSLNESFLVTFTIHENIRKQPDFAPIEHDFEILSCNQSTSTSMINGSYSFEIKWVLSLMPKQVGQFKVPSIQFDQSSSLPLAIEVKQADEQEEKESIFIKSEIKPQNSIYVQSQLTCTVALYRSVNLYQGVISEPKVSDHDAIIEKIGEDREYEKIIDNKTYAVLERTYVIYPQHEGELTLSPVKFEGQVIIGGRNMFDIQTQHVRHASQPLTIQVNPIPKPFNRLNWLAAVDVTLRDEWLSDIEHIQQGDVISRTVTLIAKGILASQIPAINLNLPSDLKQYPEKPLVFNKTDGDENIATYQIKTAIIPNQEGVLLIPEIKVKWWNTLTDKLEEAQLPEVKLHVSQNPLALADNVLKTSDPIALETAPPEPQIPVWALVLIAMNGLWPLGFLIVYIKRKLTKSRSLIEPKKPIKTLKQVKAALKIACLSGQYKEMETHLLLWANFVFEEAKICSLADLMNFVPDDLKREVEALNHQLYCSTSKAERTEPWNGDTLWQMINDFKPGKGSHSKIHTEKLDPLWQ